MNNRKIHITLILLIALSFLMACKKSEGSSSTPTVLEPTIANEQAQSDEYSDGKDESQADGIGASDEGNGSQDESQTAGNGTQGETQAAGSGTLDAGSGRQNLGNGSQEDFAALEVHFIDVGEADSALIICGGEAMLVDTGNPDQGTAIRLYLKKQKVDSLKYLLLTHSDRDHIGGAASVISNIAIDNLFMCRYEKDNEVYTNMINEIKYKNMSWSTPKVGSQFTLGDATITIVAPNKEYDNPNDSSIAFVIRHGENSFIFTGDAESPAESDIVNNGLDISAGVYYVGHHGSSTSSTQQFLDRVNPKYAVISCAKDNEYGHPHIETMDKLKAMGVTLYRTDDQGTIICHSDGNELTFNTAPSTNWANGNSETNESASTQVKNGMLGDDTTQAGNGSANDDTTKTGNGNANNDTTQTGSGNEITFVLNTNSMKFHRVGCDSVNDMKAKNRQDVSLTRDEIVELGYIPCKRCNP